MLAETMRRPCLRESNRNSRTRRVAENGILRAKNPVDKVEAGSADVDDRTCAPSSSLAGGGCDGSFSQVKRAPTIPSPVGARPNVHGKTETDDGCCKPASWSSSTPSSWRRQMVMGRRLSASPTCARRRPRWWSGAFWEALKDMDPD